MGIGQERLPTPNLQIDENVLKQTEMVIHDVRQNTMHACIKYKAYSD